MASQPLLLNQYISPIDSTRKEFIKDSFNLRMDNKKKFVFKDFKTEKERIVRLFKNILYYSE